jgi:hypothetical protein
MTINKAKLERVTNAAKAKMNDRRRQNAIDKAVATVESWISAERVGYILITSVSI